MSGQPPPFIFYLYVDDVVALTETMIQAGGTLIVPPQPMFWGDLKARVRYPFGFILDIAQKQ